MAKTVWSLHSRCNCFLSRSLDSQQEDLSHAWLLVWHFQALKIEWGYNKSGLEWKWDGKFEWMGKQLGCPFDALENADGCTCRWGQLSTYGHHHTTINIYRALLRCNCLAWNTIQTGCEARLRPHQSWGCGGSKEVDVTHLCESFQVCLIILTPS